MLLSPPCSAFPLPVYLSFGTAAGFAFYVTLAALATQQLVTSFTAAGFTFSFIHSALFTQQLMTTSYNYRLYFIFIHTALIDCLLLSMQHLVMPLTTAEFTYFHFYPSSSCDYLLQLLMLLLVWCAAVSECLSHLQSWRCFVDKAVSDCLLLLPTVLSVLPTRLATEFTPVSPTQQLLSAAYHCRLYCQFYPPSIWWLVNCVLQLQSNYRVTFIYAADFTFSLICAALGDSVTASCSYILLL